MFDKGKVLTGIFAFLIICSLPFIFAARQEKRIPDIKLPQKEKSCIEDKLYMRESHMELLVLLREKAVREGLRTYTSKDGRAFEISLTGTCIKCHDEKETFCDRCHDYVGVKPDCFSCHNYRKGGEG